jgi:hypothetical protein
MGRMVRLPEPPDLGRTTRLGQPNGPRLPPGLAALGGSRPELVTISGVNGIPAKELIKAGEGTEMIVLGSRGAGGFSRLSMGSVAAQVAPACPCPVVIVWPAHRDRTLTPIRPRQMAPRPPDRDLGLAPCGPNALSPRPGQRSRSR